MDKPLILDRRPVTLIEVLIAMTLTIAILMTLTFFYRQVTEIGFETDRVRVDNFKKRYLETRLAKVLPKAVGETDQGKDFLFFSVGDEGIAKSGSQSLIFTFDNEISLDKEFSNHVLGRIYLDPKGNLMLAYWPSPKRWENGGKIPMKKELLLEEVENIAFEFYIAPPGKEESEQIIPKDAEKQTEESEADKKKDEDDKKGNTEKKKPEPEPKGGWRTQLWLEEFQQLPVMVKMIVTLPNGKGNMVFIYPLAKSKSHVVYE